MKRPKRQIAIDLMTDHQKQCYIISIEKYATQTENKLKTAEKLLLNVNENLINTQEQIDEYFRVEEK